MELDRSKLDEFARKSGVGLNHIIDQITLFSPTYKLLLELEKLAEKDGWQKTAKYAIDRFGVSVRMDGIENIPKTGPAIYVSNHPWGILDGLCLIGHLGEEIEKRGRKLKVIGTHQINAIRGLEDSVILVHTKNDTNENHPQNLGSVKKVLKHLSENNDLAFFPASRTSYRIDGQTQDPPWGNFLGKLSSYASVVPMWFSGPGNGPMYNFAARLNPKLRYTLFFREAWNKKGEEILLRIGKPIYEPELRDLGFTERSNYLRKTCETLRE